MNHLGLLEPTDDMCIEKQATPTFLHHALSEMAGEADRCQQIDADEPVPIFVCQGEERLRFGRSAAADENVNVAHLMDQLINSDWISEIGSHSSEALCVRRFVLESRLRCVDVLNRPSVNDDVGARLGESLRNGEAHSAARTRHKSARRVCMSIFIRLSPSAA